MDINQQKPTLKIGKGELAKIKLGSNTPFKEGENEWDGVKKKWFGYNVTKGTEEMTYFASQAVHDLLQESQPEGEFTLELRSVNNKDGQVRSIWHLDGKNLWQYREDNKEVQQEEIVQDIPEPQTESEPKQTFDGKNKIIEDYVNQIDINLSNAQELLKKLKDELVVPF